MAMDASASSKSPSTYLSCYQPLDASCHEIRLLSLKFHKGRVLDAKLDVHALDGDNHVEYQALSYEWSPPITDRKEGMFLPGPPGLSSLQLSPNLSSFLEHYGQRYEEPTWTECPFWIDSVAINQADVEERTSQVQMMARIYGSASKVLAWLGPQLHSCDFDLAVFDQLCDLFQETIHEKIQELLLKSSVQRILMSLVQRSYWSRGWIIQEVVLSRNRLHFLLGNTEISSGRMYLVLVGLMRIARNYANLQYNQLSWIRRRMLRGSPHQEIVTEQCRNMAHQIFSANPNVAMTTMLYLDESPLQLHQLLPITNSSQTSDPRDRIYSLLGLARPYPNHSLAVDYTLNWQQVFRQVAIYIIRATGRLDVLICGGSSEGPLPTWVPNWSKSPIDFDLRSNRLNNWAASMSNSGSELVSIGDLSAGGNPTSLRHLRIDKDCLRVPAIFVARINDILSPTDEVSDQESMLWKLSTCIEFLLSDYKQASISTLVARCRSCAAAMYYAVTLTTLGIIHTGHVESEKRTWKTLWLKALRMIDKSGLGLYEPDQVASDKGLLEAAFHNLKIGLLTHRYLFKLRLPYPQSEMGMLQRSVHHGLRKEKALPKTTRLKLSRESKECIIKEAQTLPWNQTFGLCRVHVQPGDSVFVIPGCSFPMIVRPSKERPGSCQIVGAAWIEGLMLEEAMTRLHLPEAQLSIV